LRECKDRGAAIVMEAYGEGSVGQRVVQTPRWWAGAVQVRATKESADPTGRRDERSARRSLMGDKICPAFELLIPRKEEWAAVRPRHMRTYAYSNKGMLSCVRQRKGVCGGEKRGVAARGGQTAMFFFSCINLPARGVMSGQVVAPCRRRGAAHCPC